MCFITHLQGIRHGEPNQTRVQRVLPDHSKQSSEQNNAVPDKLNADAQPPEFTNTQHGHGSQTQRDVQLLIAFSPSDQCWTKQRPLVVLIKT